MMIKSGELLRCRLQGSFNVCSNTSHCTLRRRLALHPLLNHHRREKGQKR